MPRAAWRRALKAAKLAAPQPRFHDLRHTYATHLLAAGTGAHAVAQLLGQSDAGLVWRRCGHALPNKVAEAGAALEAWRARQ
jgi:integrase